MNDITIEDRVKRLYQRHMGGGHMIDDANEAHARLCAECEALSPVPYEEPLFETLGCGHTRMNLRPLLQTGLSLQTASAMFVYSANHTKEDREAFLSGVDGLATNDEERSFLDAYKAQSCPAIHHSEAYREAYAPAYRVVSDLYRQTFELFLRIDRMEKGIVAIDGPCTSGKSTLAEAIGGVFGITVVHMDDFFLQPSQRTPERLAEPGGNADRERFRAEALLPLTKGEDFTFRPYNCARQRLEEPTSVQATGRSVAEGVYCQHPELREAYALKVFLSVDPSVQRDRLLRRNGEALLRRFEAEWIPMENAYFEAFQVKEKCELVFALDFEG